MYVPYFGLKRSPFSIAPDPRYLFMSERHREALAHLLYGVGGGGGFVLLTGEIGAGKTTVCRCFLEQIPPRCNVAYIFNPKLTVLELLQSVCEEFRVPLPPFERGATTTVKEYIDPLNQFLLRTHAVGQNNVLIIDEAQNLAPEVLEQLRLLTNLETNERKLLQIMLIGQPELREMLQRPELEQLGQRVIARYHLDALTADETGQYIVHRLGIAGLTGPNPFDAQALSRIHQLARGVPRRINLLCDRALLGAYASGQPRVDRRIVERAALEVFGPQVSRRTRRRRRRNAQAALVALAAVALCGVVLWALLASFPASHPAARASAANASAPLATTATPASAGAASAALTAAASSPNALSLAALPSASSAAALRGAFATWPSDEQQAWRELAPLWQLAPPTDDTTRDVCAEAAKQQVLCYRGPSTLALIRELARPGILTLYEDGERARYALLMGLTAHDAVLRSGGVVQRVPLALLASMWRGDFATLWRAPPGYTGTLGTGTSSPAVEGLATGLARWRGAAPPQGRQSMDAALTADVSAFQLAQGLKPDGLAGPTTFMQLNRATGVDEPRLLGDGSTH